MELKEIHSDSRGQIYLLTGLLFFPEVTLFRTHENTARGGCIHNINSEFICVIEGEIEYVYGELLWKKRMVAGDSFVIPKETPHYFLSKTSSLVAEWGATAEEKVKKHPLFRAIVNKINEK